MAGAGVLATAPPGVSRTRARCAVGPLMRMRGGGTDAKLGQLPPFVVVFPVSHRNAWANLHISGQPDTSLAGAGAGLRPALLAEDALLSAGHTVLPGHYSLGR